MEMFRLFHHADWGGEGPLWQGDNKEDCPKRLSVLAGTGSCDDPESGDFQAWWWESWDGTNWVRE